MQARPSPTPGYKSGLVDLANSLKYTALFPLTKIDESLATRQNKNTSCLKRVQNILLNLKMCLVY